MQAQEIPGGFRSSLNMKRLLLLLLLLLLCGNVVAQPIIRNSFTTNTAGKFPLLLAAPGASSNAYPVVHIDNTGDVLEWPYLYYSSSNAFFSGDILLAGNTNRLSIAGGVLLLDGNPLAAGGTNTTNTVVNSTTVNATTINVTTITNVSNFYATNSYVVNGKNNTMIITNTLQVSGQYVYPLAAGTGITLTTNTLAAGQTNVTIASTASGGSSGSTNYRSAVVELGLSGTNVTGTIDWAATNVAYRLTLTTNAFFGDINVNVPLTNAFQWLQLHLIQDSTGGRSVTFSNGIYAGVNGTFAISTQANAFDSYTLFNSPQTNGNVIAIPVNFLHR